MNTKIQIRQDSFETNSSSSHSISITTKGRESDGSGIPVMEYFVDDSGVEHRNVVVLTGDEYGWGPDTLYSEWDKANYAATDLFLYDKSEIKQEWLKEVIKEKTGATDVVWNPMKTKWGFSAYIDHQSVGTFGYEIHCKADIENFLFNSGSFVLVDHDNH